MANNGRANKTSRYNIIPYYPNLGNDVEEEAVDVQGIDLSIIRNLIQKRLVPGQPRKMEDDLENIIKLFADCFSKSPYKEVYEYFLGPDLVIGGSQKDAQLVLWNMLLSASSSFSEDSRLTSGKNIYNWVATCKAAFIVDEYTFAIDTSKHDPVSATLLYWYQYSEYLNVMREVAKNEVMGDACAVVIDIYDNTLKDLDNVKQNAEDVLRIIGGIENQE